MLNSFTTTQHSGEAFLECWITTLRIGSIALPSRGPFADPDRKLQEAEKHALVVCSLAAIPPVPGMEGMEIDPEEEMDKWSSTKWAEHVRDVASRMATLSPQVRQAVSMTALTLLDKLVTAVGVKHCTHCFFPGDECRCPVWRPALTTHPHSHSERTSHLQLCRPNGTPDAS